MEQSQDLETQKPHDEPERQARGSVHRLDRPRCLYLDVEIYGGSHIEDACDELVALSSRLNISVWASFNGVKLHARPGDNPGRIADAYNAARKRKDSYPIASDRGPTIRISERDQRPKTLAIG